MLVNTYSKQISNRNQTFIDFIWPIQFNSNSEQFSKIKLVQNKLHKIPFNAFVYYPSLPSVLSF